jgi:hypothetical protein
MVSLRRSSWLLPLFLLWLPFASATELMVTRLDDDVDHPPEGSLRWAVAQPGVSLIQFAKAGDVKLRGTLKIGVKGLAIDGSTAPQQGVCIRGGSLSLNGAEDITLRYLRLRLGDERVLAENKRLKRKRPKNSNGLDCLSIDRSRRVLVEHCSLSWSCDELICVTRSRDVVLRYCLMSEPLGREQLHPYGDDHAFCLNASSSTLLVEHCVFSRYIMRGPQFEANDMRRADSFTVNMTARDCLMHNYQRSACRYTTGVEDHKDEAKGKQFRFGFVGNLFVDPDEDPGVEPVTKHGKHPGVEVRVKSNETLRSFPRADEKWGQLLAVVGASHARDAVDARVIRSILTDDFADTISSQRKVGGWPDLTSTSGRSRDLSRALFERDFSGF